MKYLLILCALVLSACVAPGKTTKEGSESVRAGLETQAEILESQPLIKGDNNQIDKIEIKAPLPQAQRNIEASSRSDMESSYSIVTQISLGANLILLGIGLLLLKIALKGSKAAQATMGLIDSGIASAVSMAQNSVDHKDIASANHLRSELEALKRHL